MRCDEAVGQAPASGPRLTMITTTLLFGMFRPISTGCPLTFGISRALWPTALPGVHSVRRKFFISRVRRKHCIYPAVSKASAAVDIVNKANLDIESFEDDLDAMALVCEDSDSENAEKDEQPSPPPSHSRLVESNIRILERECDVRQQTLEAMRSRAGTLYLGLDISTQSTGYAVLTPMPVAADNSVEETVLLTEFARAKLMEWGYIEGSGMGTKRKDVLDVGEVIEKRLLEIARRCVDSRSKCARGDHDSIQGAELPSSSGMLGHGKAAGCEGSGNDEAPVWVVGVEDFMRRFLPGRSSARSIFALAQLNGIVQYACHKHLGAKAESVHPSKARSFYGLLQNRPAGKNLKEIVHNFAIAHEPGRLDLRHDNPRLDRAYDITDAYLVARYSWHQDVFRTVAENKETKSRFVEIFRKFHADKLAAAEQRAVAKYMAGEVLPHKGKKKPKAMTEREATYAHRKLDGIRLTKAYETALLCWFKDRVLGITS